MTTKDLAALIGRKGLASFGRTKRGSIRVLVDILDARSAYGRTDVEVTPVAGSGSVWLDLDHVELQEEGGREARYG